MLSRDLKKADRVAPTHNYDDPDNIDGAYLFRNGITFALAIDKGAKVKGAGFHASVPQIADRLPFTAWRINEGGDAGARIEPSALRKIAGSDESQVLIWDAQAETLTKLSESRLKIREMQSTLD